jgi:hypothetical protein
VQTLEPGPRIAGKPAVKGFGPVIHPR